MREANNFLPIIKRIIVQYLKDIKSINPQIKELLEEV
jgi:hypothetical protein